MPPTFLMHAQAVTHITIHNDSLPVASDAKVTLVFNILVLASPEISVVSHIPPDLLRLNLADESISHSRKSSSLQSNFQDQ